MPYGGFLGIIQKFSKLLHNRLRELHPPLVGPTECTFICGTILLHDVMLPRCLMSLICLKLMTLFVMNVWLGFSSPKGYSVMIYLRTTFFSVGINGDTHGYFKG